MGLLDGCVWEEGAEFVGHGDVEAGCGMGDRVDVSQLVDADAGVALGCFEAGVAEEFGDVADVCSAFEHQRGDGVAEEVTASLLMNARACKVRADLA